MLCFKHYAFVDTNSLFYAISSIHFHVCYTLLPLLPCLSICLASVNFFNLYFFNLYFFNLYFSSTFTFVVSRKSWTCSSHLFLVFFTPKSPVSDNFPRTFSSSLDLDISCEGQCLALLLFLLMCPVNDRFPKPSFLLFSMYPVSDHFCNLPLLYFPFLWCYRG